MEPEDRASIEQVLLTMQAREWSGLVTLEGAFSEWRHLIRQVVEGYEDCVDEYTNDLTIRDWLHEAWPLLPEQVQRQRGPELALLDQRWRQVTVDDDGVLIGQFFRIDERSGWWWRRRPRLLVGDFAATVGQSEDV